MYKIKNEGAFGNSPERKTSLVVIPGHVSSVGVPRVWEKEQRNG